MKLVVARATVPGGKLKEVHCIDTPVLIDEVGGNLHNYWLISLIEI